MTLLAPDTIEGIDFESEVICESGTGCAQKAEWRFTSRPCPAHHRLLCQEHTDVLREYIRDYSSKTIRCPAHGGPRVPVATWALITRL
jgi:hypothetical protein